MNEQEGAHIRASLKALEEKQYRTREMVNEAFLALVKREGEIIQRLLQLEQEYAKHMSRFHPENPNNSETLKKDKNLS